MTTDIETIREACRFADRNIGTPPRFEKALERIERERTKEHEPVEMWWKLRRERAIVFRCNGVEWSMNAEEYPTVTEGWKVWKDR